MLLHVTGNRLQHAGKIRREAGAIEFPEARGTGSKRILPLLQAEANHRWPEHGCGLGKQDGTGNHR